MKIRVSKNLWINLKENNKAFNDDGESEHVDTPYRIINSHELRPLDKIILSDIYTTLLKDHTYQRTNAEIAKSFNVSKSSVSRSFRRLISQHWINHQTYKNKSTNISYQQITAINAKKVFGTPLRSKSNMIDNLQLQNFLKQIRALITQK